MQRFVAALKLPQAVAGPACLIGISNFFELVEVPVMLSLVAFVKRRQGSNAG